MTKERDSAVSQLGVAYFTIEQLKSENNILATENRELKIKNNHITASHENETQEWTNKEEDLRRQIQQTKESVRNLEEMSRDMFDGRNRSTAVTSEKGNQNFLERSGLKQPDTQSHLRIPKRSKHADKATNRNTEKTKNVTCHQHETASQSRANQQTKDLLRGIGPANNAETFHSQDSDEFLDLAKEEGEPSRRSTLQARPTSPHKVKDVREDDSSQDLTYLTFLKV